METEMETVKDILKFFNAARLYDYTNVGITYRFNQVRRCIVNNFYQIVPDRRIKVSLSIIDDII